MSVVRLALVSTMSIQSIATASTVTLSAIAPLVAAAIGMPSSFIGTYVCFIYIGAAFAAVAGGTMVTRYGGIHVSQGCLILAAIGLMLSAVANFWCICLGGLLLGLHHPGFQRYFGAYRTQRTDGLCFLPQTNRRSSR